ncbi:hypothetical protein LTR84_013170 [Exophiala bonariae]|uniref:Transcription factor domain-containing protein n=1 Tax=Exophiala bonariae TaxID=1690606 RepID=A0AAV9NGK8_9EURO|nr:hypothetical protein LTR84_013170 [Exophiala bonariae]
MERHHMESASYDTPGALISSELSPNNIGSRLPSIAILHDSHGTRSKHSLEILTTSPEHVDYMNPNQTGVKGPGLRLSNMTYKVPGYASHSRSGNPSGASKDLAPTSQAFTFVNVRTSTGKRDWAAESQIRSHAMKRVQRQRQNAKRLVKSGSTSGPQAGEVSPITGQSARACKCGDIGCSNTEYTPRNSWTLETESSHNMPLSTSCNRPRSEVVAMHGAEAAHAPIFAPKALGSPFLSLFQKPKLQMNPRMESLVCYLLSTYFQLTMPSIYGRGSQSGSIGAWRHGLRLCLSDQANLQVWCSISAYHKAAQMMSLPSSRASSMRHVIRQQQEEASQHLHNSMRLLNRHFQENKGAPSLSSVLAVSSLIIATALSGAVDAMQTHHDGLVKMIEMRGGVETFPRIEAIGLSRIDSNAAWTEGRRPRLPVYINPVPPERSFHQAVSMSPSLQGFLVNSPLFAVARDLQMVSRTLEVLAQADASLPREDAIWYEDQFAVIQHGLADFPYFDHDVDASVWYHRRNSWRNAAFIYLNTAIRTSPSKALLKLATSRLIFSVNKSDLGQWWDTHSDILLWVLSMALNGACEDEDKSVLQLRIRQLIRHMRLPSFQSLRDVLTQQMWRESVLDQPLRDAWTVDGR